MVDPVDPTPSLLETPVGRIAVTQEGDPTKSAVVCVHGIPGSVRDFRYLASCLESAFFVVRIDMPGFGQSPVSNIRSVRGWARVLFAVADTLKLEQPILLSHSFGGGAILEAAAQQPERFSNLVLLAPPGARRHRAYSLPPWVMRLLAMPTGIPLIRVSMSRFARAKYDAIGLKLPEDDRQLHNLLTVVGTLDFDRIGRQARALQKWVLLAHCDDDRIVQAAIARELAELLPRCETRFFEDGGHMLQKTRAEEIARAMLAFSGPEYRLRTRRG